MWAGRCVGGVRAVDARRHAPACAFGAATEGGGLTLEEAVIDFGDDEDVPADVVEGSDAFVTFAPLTR
jgi:hypothetical protein